MDRGQPDHRIVGPGKLQDAIRFGCCWLCGGPLGSYRAFVIGPMCAVNRVTSEPPSHRDCALYAVRACPFLTTPHMTRREVEDGVDPAGVMLRRNPGAAVVWVTRSFERHRIENGLLFQIGNPTETRWFTEGRPAGRNEALAAIDSGPPILRAEAEREGEASVRELELMHAAALDHLPEASDG
ncbi:hypothetical protein [Herbidospora mongoliensis]|uniref:hypothetical protein n=1 Tax=Herbidospora mongoliensis TaxID=688067 RepID=UPI000A03F810|nr:hypothetical protein [Herbidospora mongoliensis]